MEVVVESPRSPTSDIFDFGGTMSSPYLSAPTSPKRFGEYNYLSAPTSPSRLSQLYSEFEYFSSSSTIPPIKADDEEHNGFAFYVNDELDKSSRSAEELFDGGKIKPLNESFAEERRGRERERTTPTTTTKTKAKTTTALSSSNSGRRVTRSHSPYRETSSTQYTWQLEQQQQQQQQPQRITNSGSKGSSRRWRLRDFLLFRSASEGRALSKDPLKKFYNKKGEEVKVSSDSHGSRRRGNVSAHEMHYAMKKAETEDLKKRTFLPYRQGIFGRLGRFGF